MSISAPPDTCRFCGQPLHEGQFDAAFQDPDGKERLFFTVPGSVCVACKQLYVDQQLIGVLGLEGARCTFAIESDRVLR